MTKYTVTLKIDGKVIETKPLFAVNSAQACFLAEHKGRINFPNAEEIDVINIEQEIE